MSNNQIQVIPTSTDEVLQIANTIVSGGFAPKGMNNNQVLAAIHKGLEVGLSPMAAVQQIAIINGRPSIWGDACMALVQASGLLSDVEESLSGKGDEMEATCTVQRNDRKSPTVRTFSVEDAKTAKLWGKQGPWQQYPKRMLQMRARGFALRDCFPDVLNGLHIAEEVQDYPIASLHQEKIEERAPIMLEPPSFDTQHTEQEPEHIDAEITPPAPQDDLNGDSDPFETMLELAQGASHLGVDKFNEYLATLSKEEKRHLWYSPTKENSYYLELLKAAESVDEESKK